MATATRPARVSPAAIETEQARRHLHRFAQEAWHVIEPATTFVDNWHIRVICEHLEAVSRGEVRKLVINIPPRHMKSLLVSVFWPAWTWIDFPAKRMIYASYAEKLSDKHSVLCRRILQSRWYQERWGERWTFAGDQNLKRFYENTVGGFRMATSVGGVATGEGGDLFVVDDPHNVAEVESEVKRESVIDWYDGAISTRLNSPTAARVIIMQRVHEEDLSGHLLAADREWEHLVLPAEFEPTHPYRHLDDPRTDHGELLWPDLWDQKWITEKRAELGSYRYAGQYSQAPAPLEGGIFRKAWWGRYDEPPPMAQVIESWDMAFKDTDGSDYVVGQVWGRDLANRYLLAQIRARLDFVATCEAVEALAAFTRARWPKARGAILVEDKANGSAVIAALRKRIAGLIAVEPEGGKESRAHAVAPEVEAGNVYLPASDVIACPVDDRWKATTVDDFLHELGTFPNAAFDDQVDAFTQALIRLRARASRPTVAAGGYSPARLADR